MLRSHPVLLALVAIFAAGSAHAQTFDLDNSGLIKVQVINANGPNPGNVTANWLAVWNAIDGGAGPTGTVAGFGIQNYAMDTETVFDYAGGGGWYGVDNAIGSINNDGPGGAGGPFGGGDNYSIRAETFIQFTVGGTYTIGMASDDGRRIELTEALPGSASGYSGFEAVSDQENQGFVAGDTVIDYSAGTGHEGSRGRFSVDAGDILALDAFYYEGGGGDSGEIAIFAGDGLGTGNFSGTFELLQDGALGGAVQLNTFVQQVPEPASIVIWSLIGLGLAGFGVYRRRRK